MICRAGERRQGAVMVEAAVVLPVMLFLLLAIIVGGLMVFRYQQTAMLACQAARWASVRGGQWAQATGQTSPTQQDIFNNAVVPMAVGMDTDNISIQVSLIDETNGAVTSWDSSNKSPYSLTALSQPVTSHVLVTITYQWNLGVFSPRSMSLTSTCELPMSF